MVYFIDILLRSNTYEITFLFKSTVNAADMFWSFKIIAKFKKSYLFLELKCFQFPHHDSVPETIASFSPMAEFIPHQFDEQSTEDEEAESLAERPIVDKLKVETEEVKVADKILHYEHIVEDLFSSFKDSFQKNYKSDNEHEQRKDIFRHNMRYVLISFRTSFLIFNINLHCNISIHHTLISQF